MHPADMRPARDKSERGAAAVLLVIVLLLSAVAVLVGLRWQSLPTSGGFYYGPDWGYSDFADEPVPSLSLERAPTGDGTVLTLSARSAEPPMTLQEIYTAVIPSIVAITAEQNRGYAEGTGVIMSADGYIVTNAHIIEGSSAVTVSLEDGRDFDALLVGRDSASDLAVLKIDAEDLPAAAFGLSDDMVVGDRVAAIGNPLGRELRGTMTDGILSAVSRDIEVDGYQMTLLQTTAALNSGNSGGALVNDQGQVVGITNMKMVTSGFEAPVEGLGFAIPTSTVKPVVDALIAEGHMTGRPVLGITVRPAYNDELKAVGAQSGLMVSDVNKACDAWTQGLRPGDILLTADGVTLRLNEDLITVKDGLKAGESLLLTVSREGETLELTVKLVEQYIISGD